jgi:iron complex transport system substrate-binding protein/vitamin B12 transport system substrate-binding protein
MMKIAGAKSLRRFCVAAVLLFGVTEACALTVSDGTGRSVTLARPATRIVTLAPSTTELVYAAGGGGAMVGTVDYSDFPPAARRLPHVGGLSGQSLEAILRLRPDLVVAWLDGVSPQLLDRLRGQGIAVFVSHPLAPDDVAREMLALGRLAGTDAVAARVAASYRGRLDALRHRYRQRAPVTVFYQVGTAPLFTVSDHSFVGPLLQLCGGRNVFAAVPAPAPQVSREAVVAARPQVMLSATVRDLAIWDNWRSIPAVAYGTRYAIDTDLASRPGPRLVDAAQAICTTLDTARQVLGLTPR